MSDAFCPYRQWLGLAGRPANHYELLALTAFESDHAKIAVAGDRAITKVRAIRPGKEARAWAQLLDEIQQARACLLDPQRKAAYDAQLKAAAPRPEATQPRRPPHSAPAASANPDLYPPGMRPAATAPQPAVEPHDQPPVQPPAELQPALPLSVAPLAEPFSAAAPLDLLPPAVSPLAPLPEGLPGALPIAYPAGYPIVSVSPAALPVAGGIDPMAPVAIPLTPQAAWQQPYVPPAAYVPGHAAASALIQPAAPVSLAAPASALPTRDRRSSGRPLVLVVGGLLFVASVVVTMLVWNKGRQADRAPGEAARPAGQPLEAVRAVQTDTIASPAAAPPAAAANSAGAQRPAISEIKPPPMPIAVADRPLPPLSEPAPAPAPPPLKREDVEALVAALQAARDAISQRNTSEAQSQLAKAAGLARWPKHQEAVARLQQAASFVEQFHAAVAAALNDLKGGTSFKVGTSAEVVFVERQPDKVVLRVAGLNRAYPLNDLPPGLALAIADLKLDPADPLSKVVKGAYLLFHPAADPSAAQRQRERAKELWEEAQTDSSLAAPLMPLLSESYDAFLADVSSASAP